MEERDNGHKPIGTLYGNRAGESPPAMFGDNIDSGNAGVRLISNEDKIPDMLKAIYLEDEELARSIAEALAECDEFLYNRDGKPDREVEQRREWIKYLCATFCSVKGRFAQLYTDAATNIRTTAFSERGWQMMNYQGKQSEPRENSRNDRPWQQNKP